MGRHVCVNQQQKNCRVQEHHVEGKHGCFLEFFSFGSVSNPSDQSDGSFSQKVVETDDNVGQRVTPEGHFGNLGLVVSADRNRSTVVISCSSVGVSKELSIAETLQASC